jgi:hypothetical protein
MIFHIPMLNSLEKYEKIEMYNILLHGFLECNHEIQDDNIENCDYILLFRQYFTKNNKIKYPEKSIIIDMSDDRKLLTNIKCLYYYKRSCINKKNLSFIKYNLDVIPYAFPIKKAYMEYINSKNIFKDREIDICCTHLQIPDNHPNNLNKYRTNLVKYLKNLSKKIKYNLYVLVH